MLILKTIIHKTIWGGHLYSLYCREGISNEILNGAWKGQCLNDVFPLFKADFHLAHYPYFPLTLALTEARLNLSIQVHPNDQTANQLEHLPRGKRESWYFLKAPHSGTIINGCTCRDKAEEEMMIRHGEFLKMADTLPVKVGDYVFVEPGTLHAITAGSLVFEIEEGSDSTYRFYDYDRVGADGIPRELQLDKAKAALDFRLKSKVQTYGGREIREKTYATRLIKDTATYHNESATLECFTLVEGSLLCHDLQVDEGSTLLLWPGEILDTSQVRLAFISKILEESL